ncbi:MAG: lipid kinase [Streptosporangiales bacterium]|nr:lipid kinase [Streptosporangiales bacterium]
MVVNTRSRVGERTFSEAHGFLRDLGIPLRAVYPLHDPARIPETTYEALHEEHCDLLVLGGGDGTVSSVVDFLVDHHAALGLLPMGTANDFARTLEIPSDLRAACETVARGKVVDVDLGLAGDNYFVNVISVGLSVGVTEALSPRLKRRMGSLAYPVAAVKAFLRQEPFSARLTFPDGDHGPAEFDRLLQVAVGNGRFYGGGMVVAPESGIDDQMLDVYALRLGRHRDLLGVARYFKSGDFVRRESVASYRTRRVLLETEPELPINIDGEVVARTPKKLSVAPNVLRVLVPQNSTAAHLDRDSGV